jgi:PsbP-like protein
VVAWVGLTASLGCGGDGGNGDNTFEGDGYSFTYPESWSQREAEARYQRTDVQASSFVFGPEEGANGLILDVGQVGLAVTENNIDLISAQFAGEIEQLFQQAQGEVTKGPTRLTVGGLPALRFEASALTPDGVRARSRVTVVFNGTTQYFLNCQFTSEQAEEMKRGCDQVVRSFRVD